MKTVLTDQQRKARQNLWLKTLKIELAERIALLNRNEKEYVEIYGANLKPLHKTCKGKCAWTPATVLWIHDSKAKSAIDDVYRRGFTEARPYYWKDYQIQPQICWNCLSWREREVSLQESTTLAQKILEDRKPKRRRRRRT